MRIGYILHYSDVFPGEEIPDFLKVLKNIPTKLALEYFCFINSRLHMNPLAPSNQKILIEDLMTGLPHPIKKKLVIAMRRQIDTYGSFYMFDSYLSLKVINFLIQNKNGDERPVSEMIAKDREAIFLAILVSNQSISTEYKAD